jgi:alginate O-acetyltransferase complex protein AlgJ
MTTTRTPISFAKLRSFLRSPSTNRARLADRLAIALFAAFLAVPFVGFLVRDPVQPANENRPLHPRPDWPTKRWQWITFPFTFDRYFNDRVGFRPELLGLRRRVLLDALGDSTADLVWVGRDGWLFTNSIGPNNLPMPPAEVEQRLAGWVDALRARHDWLAARGIRYVVVVAPEKSSIYPEFLPETIRRHPPPEIGAILRERLGPEIILDPADAIRAAKPTTPRLYFQFDTHWIDPGAFIAYRELGDRLARAVPGFRAKPYERFWHQPYVNDDCDLPKALGRPPAEWREEETIFRVEGDSYLERPDDPIHAKLRDRKDGLRHVLPYLVESPFGVGRAVYLHDSFGHNLRRMLASDFRRLVCAGTYGFPTDVIEAEKPDVVIQLFVARAVTLADAKPIRPE